MEQHDIGWAIRTIQQGYKVRRAGWNGKGMWIAYTPGSSFPVEHARDGHAAKHRANEIIAGSSIEASEGEVSVDPVNLLPHIDMRAADGSMVIGWLASQTDLLADDWEVVE